VGGKRGTNKDSSNEGIEAPNTLSVVRGLGTAVMRFKEKVLAKGNILETTYLDKSLRKAQNRNDWGTCISGL